MSLIFCDSWDHYSTLTDKWSSAGTDCAIDLTGTKSRTGIGCLTILSGAFGPQRILPGSYTQLIVGTAYFSNSISNNGSVISFRNNTATEPNYVRLQIMADGSIRVVRGSDPGFTLATSAPSIYQFASYNYIEAKVVISDTTDGSVEVRVNGAVVVSISGVRTVSTFGVNPPTVETIELLGPGGVADVRHDDTYINDFSDGSDYRGAVRIYLQIPTADATPLDWTPSTGVTHFELVDEIPPNADTDFVFSAVVDDADAYVYDVTGVPANSTIQAVQHVIDARLAAAGSGSLGSLAEGALSSASIALTTDYKMHTFPYDLDPSTGLPWNMSQFPATFGPVVTA